MEIVNGIPAGRDTAQVSVVTLSAASTSYPAGYHAGNADGLAAIDADLVAANIITGKTIFGVAGSHT
jgi:hypothetical protein